MCGRYLFSDGKNQTILNIKKEVEEKYSQLSLPMEEVCPGSLGIILLIENGKLVPEVMHWGYHRSDKKILIINARLETIQKNMFANDYKEHRCVVPASGFFEWDAHKKKHYISASSKEPLFMAGIYRKEETGFSYCIITKEATEALKTIHSRMPVLLSQEEALKYCQTK